jgi:hypothetical protein
MSDYLRGQVLHEMLNELVGPEPLRDRLTNVAGYLVPRIYGQFEDDPVLKGKMLGIAERLTKVKAGPGDDGNIDATCKRFSDEEASSIAKDIVAIAFEEMERA